VLFRFSLLGEGIPVEACDHGLGSAGDVKEDGRNGSAEISSLGQTHEHGDAGDGVQVKGKGEQQHDGHVVGQSGNRPHEHSEGYTEKRPEEIVPCEHHTEAGQYVF